MLDRPMAPVLVTAVETGARASLRTAAPEAAAAALGFALPARIGDVADTGGRRALCLGPDEWLLLADTANAFGGLAIDGPHSLVDITDREEAFRIAGPAAADALAVGCPRDLEALAPGRGTRTVFDGISVVILRLAPDAFELHAWRSFAPHVRHLLDVAAAELAIGI